MTIQWYPGHMHKAQKEIKQSLSNIDVVIEILDARIPFSSENPLIAKLSDRKPCVKVLNKSDLADLDRVRQWQIYLEKQCSIKTLSVSKESTEKIRKLPELCKKLLFGKTKRNLIIRAMIVGIPNVGKSTLINILAGKAVAKTGNEPAVTKAQQSIKINDDFILFDTPGILWPKQEFEKSSYRLASTGAVKDTALEYEDVAFFAADFLMAQYPQLLIKRYGVSTLPNTEIEFLELIGRQRGCLAGGGKVDLTKISEIFINDLRTGALGKVCFETPSMIQQEIEEKNKLNISKKS